MLQETLRVSLAEHHSRLEQEARDNVEMVNKHLESVEIEKMVEGSPNGVDDSSPPRNDEQNIPGTRLEPRSDKESPKVKVSKDNEIEISKDKEVEIPSKVIPVNVNDDEEDEITAQVYELKRREKGKIVEETRNTPIPTTIRSPRIHTNLVSSDTEKLQELTDPAIAPTPSSSSQPTKLSITNSCLSLLRAKPGRFKRYKSFFQELQDRYGYLFAHLKKRFMPRRSFDKLADHLQEVMAESLPTMVDSYIKKKVEKQVPDQVKIHAPVYVAEGLILERKQAKEEIDKMISKAILQERGRVQTEIQSQIQQTIDHHLSSLVDTFVRNYMSGHILHVHPTQPHVSSISEQQYQLYLSMKDDLQLQQQDIAIWLALQMKFDPPRNSAKRQKTSEYEAYGPGESSGQGNDSEPGLSTSGNQEQVDDYDWWTDSYVTDDDEIPTKQISQDVIEEISLTINEAELKKLADEMLRRRCTSGDEHQYHIDQIKRFLESDIVWESRREILELPHSQKTTSLVQSCQRDPKAPALSLINQDLLYLKKGSSGPEKIVLSLHKFPAIIFNDDDIEERTSRWVNKKQREPRKPKEEVYSNSKIIQVVKTFWELGHEHKFITEIVLRRANKCIVLITESDYKNLNKNDIEDMYLLIINGKVPDYAKTGLLWSLSVFIRSSVIWERVHDFQLGIESYQQKVNLTAPTISFPGIEEFRTFTIVYEPVHGIIYKNSKKEKRVMRHSEIHKFWDATLKRVLKGLKSYNNDVKYGYIQRDLTQDEIEYLRLFEEEIEVRLKYRDQMRRWEMYVNGRPLGPRRERPE
ncbi:hypothetical protein Tco_1392655 [Tanacetum coccineum]